MIVCVHGLGRTGASMAGIALAARQAGYAVFSPSLPIRRMTVDDLAGDLGRQVAAFRAVHGGTCHFISHPLGGLIVHAMLAGGRPAWLGRVVMLAPPFGGSGWMDLLFRLRLNGLAGPAAYALRTIEREVRAEGHALGIIAGDRSFLPALARHVLPHPNDGKVMVPATRIAGMADHVVMPVPHPMMVLDRRVRAQALAFIANGRFDRA